MISYPIFVHQFWKYKYIAADFFFHNLSIFWVFSNWKKTPINAFQLSIDTYGRKTSIILIMFEKVFYTRKINYRSHDVFNREIISKYQTCYFVYIAVESKILKCNQIFNICKSTLWSLSTIMNSIVTDIPLLLINHIAIH